MCWWLPPPCGCSTGFMATPRTFGHSLRFTLYLWYATPAFKIGLSIRPPPATMPTIARQLHTAQTHNCTDSGQTVKRPSHFQHHTYVDATVFFMPEGKRILVVPFSSL
jgi:hypothetical protein